MTHPTKQQCAAVYSGKQCQLDAQHTGRHLRHLDSGQRLEWWEGEALTSKLCNCLDNECHAVPGWTCRKKIMGPDHADEQGVEVVCEAGSSLTPSGAPVRAKAVEPDRSRLLTSKNESRLLAALQRYGTHADYCAMYKGPIEDGCNCGLFEAMGLAPDGKPLSGDGSQVETTAQPLYPQIILDRLRQIANLIDSRPVMGHWPAMMTQPDADFLRSLADALKERKTHPLLAESSEETKTDPLVLCGEKGPSGFICERPDGHPGRHFDGERRWPSPEKASVPPRPPGWFASMRVGSFVKFYRGSETRFMHEHADTYRDCTWQGEYVRCLDCGADTQVNGKAD